MLDFINFVTRFFQRRRIGLAALIVAVAVLAFFGFSHFRTIGVIYGFDESTEIFTHSEAGFVWVKLPFHPARHRQFQFSYKAKANRFADETEIKSDGSFLGFRRIEGTASALNCMVTIWIFPYWPAILLLTLVAANLLLRKRIGQQKSCVPGSIPPTL